MLCEKAFGMKLDPMKRKQGVGYPHDHTVLALGRNQQLIPFQPNNQRMVAGRGKRRRDVLEKPLMMMLDETCLPVHGNGGLNGFPSKRLVNTLHSQAHSQDRDSAAKGLYQFDRDPRMGRVFGSRTDEDVIRVKCFDFFYGYLVTSMHANIKVIVHEHLHQIVGKGIVIIDDQQLRGLHSHLKKKPPRRESGWLSPMT
jgi:hypothetical protein